MADAPRAKTSASVLRKLLSPQGPPFYVLTFVVQLLAALFLSRVTSLDFILSLRTIFATVGIGAFLGAWTLSGEEGDIASGRMWDARVAETPFDAERTAANFPWILVLVAYGVGLFVLAIVLPG